MIRYDAIFLCLDRSFFYFISIIIILIIILIIISLFLAIFIIMYLLLLWHFLHLFLPNNSSINVLYNLDFNHALFVKHFWLCVLLNSCWLIVVLPRVLILLQSLKVCSGKFIIMCDVFFKLKLVLHSFFLT